jgi:hypothetical protein
MDSSISCFGHVTVEFPMTDCGAYLQCGFGGPCDYPQLIVLDGQCWLLDREVGCNRLELVHDMHRLCVITIVVVVVVEVWYLEWFAMFRSFKRALSIY